MIESEPGLFLGEIAVVIGLSALFETVQHWAKQQLDAFGDPTGKKILDALSKEVTVLGFIGLLLFIVTRSGAADVLAVAIRGSRNWGSEADNPIAETFETVHILIFMLLVALLLQSSAVLLVTRRVKEFWHDCERSRAFGSEDSSLESLFVKEGYLDRIHSPGSPRETELVAKNNFTYGSNYWERLQLRQDSLHRIIMYRAIRHEFIYPRRENRRAYPRVRDPALFSFADYLGMRLGDTVMAIVEIDIFTWLSTLAVLVPVLVVALQQDALTVEVIRCAAAWSLAAVGTVAVELLQDDTYKFTPRVPDDPRLTLRIFDGTSNQMLRRAAQIMTMKAKGEAEDACHSPNSLGQRYRPGLGNADRGKCPKPSMKMPVFFDESLTGTNTNLSQNAYTQVLRFIGFLQAILVTSLIVRFFNEPLTDPKEVAIYLLTWAEWPVMLFKIVPAYLRRLTIRNSVEGKKNLKVMRKVSAQGNEGLLRDFVVLVRLAGLGRRAAFEDMHHTQDKRRQVELAVEDFKSIGPTEQREIWNLFAVWDADNTGTVSTSEVAQTFRTMGFSGEISQSAATNILHLVDDDGSGSFTWRKLQAAAVLAVFNSSQHEVEDLETFFDLLDENGDDEVTVFELTEGLRRMRIGLTLDDIANVLYSHFGQAKMQISREDFVDWASGLQPMKVSKGTLFA